MNKLMFAAAFMAVWGAGRADVLRVGAYGLEERAAVGNSRGDKLLIRAVVNGFVRLGRKRYNRVDRVDHDITVGNYQHY